MSKWICPECGGTWDKPNLNEIGREVFEILDDVKMCSRCCSLKLANQRIAELEAALKEQAILTMYYNGHGNNPERKAVNRGYDYKWQEYLTPSAKKLLMPERSEQ